MTRLPFRPTLVLNSFLAALLEKDCAVCKDQFSLNTEDPDEQVVIELPCKHPFHSPCILPWLKQNGTCPSCRYQLIPQPGSTTNPNENTGPGPSTTATSPPQPTATANPFVQSRADTYSSRWPIPSRDRDRGEHQEGSDGGGGGFLGMVGNLFHSLAGGHPSSGPAPSGSGSGPSSLPGSWESESGNRSSNTRGQSTQPAYGTYPNPGSTRTQSPPRDPPAPPTFGSRYSTSSSNRDRTRDSTSERPSYSFGRHRRSSRDRERERHRDRNGQRRDTHRWDTQDLD